MWICSQLYQPAVQKQKQNQKPPPTRKAKKSQKQKSNKSLKIRILHCSSNGFIIAWQYWQIWFYQSMFSPRCTTMDGMDTLIYIIYVEIFWLKGQQNAVVTLLYYHATCEIKFWVQQTPTHNKLGAPAVFFSIHSLAHTHIRMDTHTLQISCEFIFDFHLVLSQSQCNRHTFCCKASITGRMIWNTSFCHKPAQQAHPSVAKPVQQAADWFEIHPFVTNQHNRHILLLQSQYNRQQTDLKYILLSQTSTTGTSFCCKASSTSSRLIWNTSFCQKTVQQAHPSVAKPVQQAEWF